MPKAINLLPKAAQAELRYETLYHKVVRAIVVAASLLLLAIVVSVSAGFYLRSQQADLAAQTEQLQQAANNQENKQLKQRIKNINGYMTDYQNLSQKTPEWSKVIGALAGHVPPDVKITQLQADTKLRRIDVAGQSPTRDAVVEFYNNIQADTKFFSSINYPLDNVAKPTNVSFRFTILVKDTIIR
jgi:Tfp pilus assembly protein PilN